MIPQSDERVNNEFIYDVKIPSESKDLTKAFQTGEFILFGFVPEKGWVKVFYESIGLVDKYLLVRKKVFPIIEICGNCTYFDRGACLHKNSRDTYADSDTDRKCYNKSFVSIPWDWDSYTNKEKDGFRHRKIKRNYKEKEFDKRTRSSKRAKR